MGELSVLNVAGGDITISFDKNNVSEAIRAKRVIQDMLKRGYALLVEVDGAWQRAEYFDAEKGEYIVADFDPSPPKQTTASSLYQRVKGEFVPTEKVDQAYDDAMKGDQEVSDEQTESTETPAAEETEAPKRRGRKRRLPMEKTNAVGIARSAGG